MSGHRPPSEGVPHRFRDGLLSGLGGEAQSRLGQPQGGGMLGARPVLLVVGADEDDLFPSGTGRPLVVSQLAPGAGDLRERCAVDKVRLLLSLFMRWME